MLNTLGTLGLVVAGGFGGGGLVSVLISVLVICVVATIIVMILRQFPGAPAFIGNIVWMIAALLIIIDLLQLL